MERFEELEKKSVKERVEGFRASPVTPIEKLMDLGTYERN
jgi:hypothetical protein